MKTLNEWYSLNSDWVESFYEIYEKSSGRPRPVDYKERAYKILTGHRNPVKNQSEGRSNKLYQGSN